MLHIPWHVCICRIPLLCAKATPTSLFLSLFRAYSCKCTRSTTVVCCSKKTFSTPVQDVPSPAAARRSSRQHKDVAFSLALHSEAFYLLLSKRGERWAPPIGSQTGSTAQPLPPPSPIAQDSCLSAEERTFRILPRRRGRRQNR